MPRSLQFPAEATLRLCFTNAMNATTVERLTPVILSTGCGRCGTGFMSQALKSFGLDVGHEKLGRNGTSDWYLASNQPSPTGVKCRRDVPFNLFIHQVRHPFQAFESILQFIVRHRSFRWVQQSIRREIGESLTIMKDEYELAFAYWLYWNVIAERNIQFDYRFRVEDGQNALYRMLQPVIDELPLPPVEVSIHYNTGFVRTEERKPGTSIRRDAVKPLELDVAAIFQRRISLSIRHGVIAKAREYGYEI